MAALTLSDPADFAAVVKTVVSAGTVPLGADVTQRAQAQLLQAGGGGGARPSGIGNYGAGGFGGGGSSAATAMDVDAMQSPAAGAAGGGGGGGGGGGAGGGGGQWPEETAQLVAMGFQREAVVACLEACQGNLQQASEILMS